MGKSIDGIVSKWHHACFSSKSTHSTQLHFNNILVFIFLFTFIPFGLVVVVTFWPHSQHICSSLIFMLLSTHSQSVTRSLPIVKSPPGAKTVFNWSWFCRGACFLPRIVFYQELFSTKSSERIKDIIEQPISDGAHQMGTARYSRRKAALNTFQSIHPLNII